MRDYSKISPQFWTGRTGRLLREAGPDVQHLAIYLISCPASNLIGLYYLPLVTMSHETGLPLEPLVDLSPTPSEGVPKGCDNPSGASPGPLRDPSRSQEQEQEQEQEHDQEQEQEVIPPPRARGLEQVDLVIAMFNEICCPPLDAVIDFQPHQKRIRRLARWIKQHPDLNWWRQFFERVAHSDFLTGKCPPAPGRKDPFFASLDWIVGPDTFPLILEGKYDNKPGAATGQQARTQTNNDEVVKRFLGEDTDGGQS